MKKLLGIVVLGLLICENVFAGVEAVLKEIKKNKDIVQGFDKVKEFDTWNEWRVTPKAILNSDKSKRQHIVKIVNKSDNHPVRFGKQSLRFEVRNGDGWGWDARNDRERSELLICCVNKETTWTAWSVYLPLDHKIIYPVNTMLAQFHNDADNPPAFAFNNKKGGYWISIDEYIWGQYYERKLIDHLDTLGEWNDILVNAKWTHKKNGFFKIWINGKLALHYKGMTQEKGENMEFHIGIYRSYMSRTPGPDKTQIAYYDEIRHAKSCKKLKINDLGYSCEDIENQN